MEVGYTTVHEDLGVLFDKEVEILKRVDDYVNKYGRIVETAYYSFPTYWVLEIIIKNKNENRIYNN